MIQTIDLDKMQVLLFASCLLYHVCNTHGLNYQKLRNNSLTTMTQDTPYINPFKRHSGTPLLSFRRKTLIYYYQSPIYHRNQD